jgi:fatty acid desaturase
LNETVFYFSSFIFGQEPMYRRYTHMSHHAKTWYPDKDLQMDYLNPITLLGYVHATSGLPVWWDVVSTMPRHALGRLSRAELDVIPQAEVRKLVWGSRAFLGGYAALAATAVFARTLSPLYLFFLPRFLGGWVVNFFINTQHMCMAQSRPDHRETTRSVDCSYLSRFLYWNMNYHLEHHLFPGVPFHSLAALSKTLGPQLPIADSGFLRSNLGILRIVIKQRRDPTLVAAPRYRGT